MCYEMLWCVPDLRGISRFPMTLVPWNLRQQMKMGFVLTFNNFYVGMKTQMILHLQPSVRGPVPTSLFSLKVLIVVAWEQG